MLKCSIEPVCALPLGLAYWIDLRLIIESGEGTLLGTKPHTARNIGIFSDMEGKKIGLVAATLSGLVLN